jgi:Phage integrase, N-terminal SAM-like domain
MHRAIDGESRWQSLAAKPSSRFDVEWRLPDRSKGRKSFKTEREARVFEAAIVTKSVSGDVVDPRAGRVTLATVYQSWLDESQGATCYEDIWRLRIEPRFGGWSVGKIDHQSIQKWVNELAQSGLSPRTLRWIHWVLKMCLDHAADEGQLLGRNPAVRTKFPPMRPTAHTYLTTAEVASLTPVCGGQGDVVSLLAYTGMRFGELTGLHVAGRRRSAAVAEDHGPRVDHRDCAHLRGSL